MACSGTSCVCITMPVGTNDRVLLPIHCVALVKIELFALETVNLDNSVYFGTR